VNVSPLFAFFVSISFSSRIFSSVPTGIRGARCADALDFLVLDFLLVVCADELSDAPDMAIINATPSASRLERVIDLDWFFMTSLLPINNQLDQRDL
jgi:hypothetical protein